MQIRCAVACQYQGVADIFFCTISCTEAAYDNGVHYEFAEELAEAEGYSGPMVVFDENDGPAWLFEHFFDAKQYSQESAP